MKNSTSKKTGWFLIAPLKLKEMLWYWDKNGNLVIPKAYINSKKWVMSKGTNK